MTSPQMVAGMLEAAFSLLAARNLYHTTSWGGLEGILKSRKLKPHGYDFPYVSFSERPFTGDIRGNDVIIVFDSAALSNAVMKVEYDEAWYDRYPEHAAYIAGEGWIEQYVEPDDCYDDEGWADDDCLEEDRRYAELAAFEDKSDEREWVSKKEGPVSFRPSAVVAVLAVSPGAVERVRETVRDLGYDVPVEAK